MINNFEDLKNKAVENKSGLKKEGLTILIGDEEQNFRISGIGEKAVKIEKFMKYEDIIEAIDEGKTNGLEATLKKVIEEYEPPVDEEEE